MTALQKGTITPDTAATTNGTAHERTAADADVLGLRRCGASYLMALPGQLELRTSSGCVPVNAVAAVGSLRSW